MLRSRKNHWLVAQLLLLMTAHLPLPCYDADGENRGVVTEGVLDPAAWHFILLGVTPESDVDRGPFNKESDGQPHGGTAFDAPYVASAKALQADPDAVGYYIARCAHCQRQLSLSTASGCKLSGQLIPGTFAASFSARAPQAWLDLLGVLIV